MDIGSVDCVICYDGGYNPIRLIQRLGRTGRKYDGNVYYLLMKGNEQEKIHEAKENAKKMKDAIKEASKLTYSY